MWILLLLALLLPGEALASGWGGGSTAGSTFSGPGSSTDKAVVRFNGTGGATVQNGIATEDDSGNVTATSFISPDATPANVFSIFANTSGTPSCAGLCPAGKYCFLNSASNIYDTCNGTSLLFRFPAVSTTATQALFATATSGAPAFRAIASSDISGANTHLILPMGTGLGTLETSTNVDGSTSNILYCARVIPLLTIAGATKIAQHVATGVSGNTCGYAIYNDADAGARIATTGALNCTNTESGTDISAIGLTAFTLTSGTVYRACYCDAFAVTATTLAGVGTTGSGLWNKYIASVGSAANGCTAGAPPSTTGLISASPSMEIGPFALISAE